MEEGTWDPATVDVVEESEDIEPKEVENMNEEVEGREDATLNNDLYFTNDGFI